MVIAKDVHDVMRPVSSIKDVTQNMERIDGQSLDQLAEGDDEIVCPTGADDGVDNHFDVCLSVRKHGVVVQQFLNDIRELLRQCFPNLGTGILGRNILTQGNQLVQCSEIPTFNIRFNRFHQVELLFRIVN